MKLHLDANEYHTRLSPEDRARVDAWLDEVFGPRWPRELVTKYEVIGEGTVRIERWDKPSEIIHTSSPPPDVRLLEGSMPGTGT